MKMQLWILFLIVSTLSVIGCGGGGGSDDSAADEGAVEMEAMEEEVVMEPTLDGNYTGIASFLTSITVRSETMPESEPATAMCEGDVDITVDGMTVSGMGSCLTDANAASFVIDAVLSPDSSFSGTIVFDFSSVMHSVALEGSIADEQIAATFMGTTQQSAMLVIDWDGSFTAQKQ